MLIQLVILLVLVLEVVSRSFRARGGERGPGRTDLCHSCNPGVLCNCLIVAVVVLLGSDALSQSIQPAPLNPSQVPVSSAANHQQAIAQQKELLDLLLTSGTLDMEARLSSEPVAPDQSFAMADEETQAPASRRARLNNLRPFLERLNQTNAAPLIKLQTSTKWIRAGAYDYSPYKYTAVLWLEAPRKLYLLQEVAAKNLSGIRGPWRVTLTRHLTVPLELANAFYEGLAQFQPWTAQALNAPRRNARSTLLQTNGLELTFTASLRNLRPTYQCGVRDADSPPGACSLELDEQRTEDLLQLLESLSAVYEAERKVQAQAPLSAQK